MLAACLAGGIKAELSTDIRREIWQKFVFLVGLSGTTTTMRTTIGPIRANPQTRAFLLDVMREVVAVGRALGVDLPADYAAQRLKLTDDVAPDMTSSMHHDLQRGNKLEVRWLAGGVVELGAKVGVPDPAQPCHLRYPGPPGWRQHRTPRSMSSPYFRFGQTTPCQPAVTMPTPLKRKRCRRFPS